MIDLAIDGRLLLYDEFDIAIQELDLLFNTENTELIGYPMFGTNFDQFLWAMAPITDELKNYILDKINNYTTYLKKYIDDIEINSLQGEYRLIYHVKIYLKFNNENVVKEYELR